ncbi:MAG: CDP-alcohol phosphatidyltransferase family protein [Candidatus Palauibacterales bacterium]|nr:CDP-alcohol phosphatidyltransferase family protein [Candidatus Palauibacterales bacterium]
MIRALARLPDLLTAIRLALVPLLWVAALTGRAGTVGWGLLLAGLTDAADGFAARRLGSDGTAFGARFDSLADNLLLPSCAVWLWLLRPELLRAHPVLVLAWVGLFVVSIGAGWIRFRRFGNLHLYSAKVAAVALYAFIVSALLLPGRLDWIIVPAGALGILTETEALLILLTRREVDEHVGSILLPRRDGR